MFTIVVVGMVVCVEGAACGPSTICSAVNSGCLWRKYSQIMMVKAEGYDEGY